ncbi:MAG: hypothetical protein LC753_16510 [Acidobacteria bacterium]|nr:hypothetical protein [Acidobacteriota bacterium]
MLRWVLHQHGFSNVVTGHVTAFRSGDADFLRFVAEHDPAVFVWDITIPYEPNWRFLQVLLASDAMKGRKLVVTTTNKRRLKEIIGPTESLEIVGKPYDLERIPKAVQSALGTG